MGEKKKSPRGKGGKREDGKCFEERTVLGNKKGGLNCAYEKNSESGVGVGRKNQGRSHITTLKEQGGEGCGDEKLEKAFCQGGKGLAKAPGTQGAMLCRSELMSHKGLSGDAPSRGKETSFCTWEWAMDEDARV